MPVLNAAISAVDNAISWALVSEVIRFAPTAAICAGVMAAIWAEVREANSAAENQDTCSVVNAAICCVVILYASGVNSRIDTANSSASSTEYPSPPISSPGPMADVARLAMLVVTSK